MNYRDKWQRYFKIWNDVCGMDHAIKSAIRSCAKLDEEKDKLKRDLANARRALTNERKKK